MRSRKRTVSSGSNRPWEESGVRNDVGEQAAHIASATAAAAAAAATAATATALSEPDEEDRTLSADDGNDEAASLSSVSLHRPPPPRRVLTAAGSPSPWHSFFASPRTTILGNLRPSDSKFHLSEDDDDDDIVDSDSVGEEHDDGDGLDVDDAHEEHDDEVTDDGTTADDREQPRIDRRRRSPSSRGGTSFARRHDGLHQRRRNDSVATAASSIPHGASTSSPYRTTSANPLQPPHYRGRLIHPSLLKRQSSHPKATANRRLLPWGWCHLHALLAAVAASYALLALHVYHRSSSSSSRDRDAARLLDWQYQLEKRRMARTFLDRKQVARREEALSRGRQRGQQRREWTTPRSSVVIAANLRAPSPVLRDVDLPDVPAVEALSPASPLATMEDLCGYYAQNASLAVPHLYPRRDALGEAARPARVLITGILNPLGYHLALTLRERCQVTHLVGIDYLFPNTVPSRLEKLDQIQVLTTQLEGVLERPILAVHTALEPTKSGVGDGAAYLDTGELDLVRTFRPTHVVHLAAYGPEVYKTSVRNELSPYVSSIDHPSLYSLRSSLTSMEHILRSVAANPEEDRPHVLYLSSPPPASSRRDENDPYSDDKFLLLHRRAREMDEILARSYHERHGVFSTALRIPDAVFGPWGHPESATYRILEAAVSNATTAADEDPATAVDSEKSLSSPSLLNVVYVGDVVEGLVAAMQLRSPDSLPLALELPPRATLPPSNLYRTARAALLRSSPGDYAPAERRQPDAGVAAPEPTSAAAHGTRRYLEWSPSTSLNEGLVRTLAWHLDRTNRFGASPHLQHGNASSSSSSWDVPSTGDSLLGRHGISPCEPDDVVCHGGPSFLPCASECATRSLCTPSVFDGMVMLMHEVLEGCDVVLYTQALDHTDELTLETEYMEEGNPLVCTVAFVNFESRFVQTVVKKVPDAELVKLGVAPRHEDGGTPEGIHKLKKEKLNGRLLYLGWLLVWPEEVPDVLSHSDRYLLKLSPGRIFPPELKYGVFIEQSFGASPRTDDVYFLMHSLTRPAIPGQLVKSKTAPKIKFRLPPEPPKRAVLLLSELRRQESSKSSRSYSDSKLSVRQASRYMRFELGEDPIGKESVGIKQQREFYERVTTLLNSNSLRSPADPLYKFEFKHLARTRWVVHDLQAEEGRQLRCDWYREHVQWNSTLDQLSFAFVMARRELERRIAHQELDDRVKMSIANTIEKKKLLTDVFEWHPLRTEVNRHYSPFTEVDEVRVVALPATTETDDSEGDEGSEHSTTELLFARIISDRYLSAARKSWNARKKS